MRWKGPTALFTAWLIHDIEEALAFPTTCDRLAERTGKEELKITPGQSWTAVSLMGILVAVACLQGVRTEGKSTFYQTVVAGLEAHVLTHLGASFLQRGYSAGVATALPVMLPGALIARREIQHEGDSLCFRDTVKGAALLIPAAVVCQVLARKTSR